jgi:hypothetical protein
MVRFSRGRVKSGRSLNQIRRSVLAVALVILGPMVARMDAQSLTITPASVWGEWSFPSGALKLEDGRLQPFLYRKNINAARGAAVRGAGSNASAAAALFDGDPQSTWAPDPDAPLRDQWVELDLQQVLPIGQVRVRFHPDSTPLEFFEMSFSDGERFIDVANVLVPGSLRFGSSQTFSFNDAHTVTIDLEDRPVCVVRLQATRRTDGVRIAEIEIHALGDNVGFDLIAHGGSVDVVAEIVALAGNAAVMFDGDMATAWRVNPLAKGSTGGGETFGDYRIDLGANYRIDSILLFGDPIAIQPRSRGAYANFLSYQILHSDGSLAPDGSLEWQVLASLPGDQRNLFDVRNFTHHFEPIAARYLRLFYPTSVGGSIIGGSIDGVGLRLDGLGYIGEFQIFGDGYPERVTLRSPVIDLGSDWNITALSWDAEVPAGARMLFRTRSGDEVEQETHYYDSKGKEVTERRYGKLIKNFRGPVVTVLSPSAGWSAWSEEYLSSGTAFRSPSPRRYLQIEAELLSDEPRSAATLGDIVIEYGRPLAGTAVGEVVPAQTEPGLARTFSYFLRPTFEPQNLGFDRVLLESTIPILFEDLLMDGQPVDGVTHEPTAGGFRLHLPTTVDAVELLEVRFDATVFQRTRFHATLEVDRAGENLRQTVDPGDALAHMGDDSDIVSLPVNGTLFANLAVSSAIFTPNGDGVHDVVTFSFDALRLTSDRPILALVYDLRGRPVRRLGRQGGAGHYDLSWDGLDEQGNLSPPGLYLLRVEIVGDALTGSATRVVGLAY